MSAQDLLVVIVALASVAAVIAGGVACHAHSRISALPKPPYLGEWPPRPGTILDSAYDYRHLPWCDAVESLRRSGFLVPNSPATGQPLEHSRSTKNIEATCGGDVYPLNPAKLFVDSGALSGSPDHDAASRLQFDGEADVTQRAACNSATLQRGRFHPTEEARSGQTCSRDGDTYETAIDDLYTELSIGEKVENVRINASSKELTTLQLPYDLATPDGARHESNTVAVQRPPSVHQAERRAQQRYAQCHSVHGHPPDSDHEDSAGGAA